MRLFAFGVGYDVDTVLLDQLSSKQRGTSAYVQPEQDIEEEVSGFYAKVSSPVLVDVEAAFAGCKVEDLYPYPLPDLFAGSQLVVAGRYRGRRHGRTRGCAGRSTGKPRATGTPGLTFVGPRRQRVHRPAVGAAQDRLSAGADPAARASKPRAGEGE